MGLTASIRRTANRVSRVVRAGRAAMSTAYKGASLGRRLILWNPGSQNINAMMAQEGDFLTNRSRDGARNSSWANEIVEEWVSNAVGSGITLQFLIEDQVIRKELEDAWRRFVDECDADGMQDLYGLQGMACREIILGSESLSRVRPRLPQDGLLTPMQIQMLQSEHLPRTKHGFSDNGNVIRSGIEFNKIGKKQAFHLYREHPGAGITALNGLNSSILTTRVPAQSVIHCFRVLEAGQFRGEPWLSRALPKLYQFDQFVDATLSRQKMGALMFAWVKQQSDGAGFPETGTLPDGTAAPDGVAFGNIEPDTVVKLGMGEDLDFFKNPEISTQYETFVNLQLREILASAGMTLEMFDVSKVNFSSIRAGVQKFRRRCEQFQFGTIVFQFCRPMLSSWMDAYVLTGQAKSFTVDQYVKNRADFLKVEWRTPRWEWVDPLKDFMTELGQIRAGLKSLSQSIRERGYDPEQVFQELAADRKRLSELGLILDSDPSRTDQSGAFNTIAQALVADQQQQNQQQSAPN